jgi:hypothetical protein
MIVVKVSTRNIPKTFEEIILSWHSIALFSKVQHPPVCVFSRTIFCSITPNFENLLKLCTPYVKMTKICKTTVTKEF